ncbi:MAG: histidine phosphatase family protein [Acidobacteria bacterium]|nr:histidine phosphatase family protein [Acidobacteriota bacterium]MBV9477693.1 histidine phosphatase family protein [Acidobacteriota bacterium]
MKRDGLLILLRHGIAEDKGHKADAERRLTAEGNAKMQEIAKTLARLVPEAEAIYSSPLVRARETGAWVAEAYGGKLAFYITDALVPGSDPDAFREFLHDVKEPAAYFVGHEPTLSAFMLSLTGMSGDVDLKKGGCYGLRWSGRHASLEWMLPPRLMRG